MEKTPLDIESDEIHRRTRRSLLIAGIAAAIGGGLWRCLNSWSRIDGLNAPYRKILDFNAAIARGPFQEDRVRLSTISRKQCVPSVVTETSDSRI
jgi:hypothetical protein